MLTNCNNKNQPVEVDFDTIKVVKDFDAQNNDGETIGKATIQINYVYPKYVSGKTPEEAETNLQKLTKLFNKLFLGNNNSTDVQEALDNYVEIYYNHFNKVVQEIALDVDLENEINFTHTLIDSVNIVNDTIIALNVYMDNYEGGAHPIYANNYKNINLNNFSIITEDDIFVDGYKEKLTEIIKTKLLETSFKDYITEETTEEDIKSYFNDFDKIAPNGNFLILDDGIKYIYNPYEIAPYAAGNFEVLIPNSELSEIRK